MTTQPARGARTAFAVPASTIAAGRVAVLGSTGGTGRAVIDAALRGGHHVSAAARRPEDLAARSRLRTVRADVVDGSGVDEVIAGADVVVSALGIGMRRHATEVYSQGARHTIDAMLRHNVSRLVVISTSSLGPPPRRLTLAWWVDRGLLQPLLRKPYQDMRAMESLVRESGLAWTLLRAARLTDGPAVGRYRLSASGRLAGAWSISRADLAHAALDLASRDDAAGRTYDIAY